MVSINLGGLAHGWIYFIGHNMALISLMGEQLCRWLNPLGLIQKYTLGKVSLSGYLD